MNLKSKKNNDFGEASRIVGSEKGYYLEFEKLNFNPVCKPGEEWRTLPKYKNCKYFHLINPKEPETKIYHQKGEVSYAQYKVGLYYISCESFMFSEDIEDISNLDKFVYGKYPTFDEEKEIEYREFLNFLRKNNCIQRDSK